MSISVTRTLNNRPKQNENKKEYRPHPHRVHDYLYDPVYTVSGEVDHAKSRLKAYASMGGRVRKVPEFGSMFSHLPHHPRYALRLETTDPVPGFIDRRWRGHMEQRNQALRHLAGVGVQSSLGGGAEEYHVTGADGWKFYKRPLSPFDQQFPADVIFALEKGAVLPTGGKVDEQKPGPFQRTVGVQTDYRDSEAQTEPYSPDYVVRPGTSPSELQTLATLTWGRGLPAGLAEVELIERARAKRAWEATLPPLSDLSQLDKRRRMMEEMEVDEWAFRESEIHKLKEARLAVLRDLLRRRQDHQHEAMAERLQLKQSQLQRDKETRLTKMHGDYVRALRKLEDKRRNVEGKVERRDIVRDYADYSSATYAPLTRNGGFPPNQSTQNNAVVQSRFLDTHQGLLELEAGLASSVLEPCVKAPKPRVRVSLQGFTKRSERRDMDLMKTYQALKDDKERVVQKKSLRFLVKKDKPVPRPLTPRVEEPPEGEEERELAVIHLQKLLRGRSIQKQMFEGKEKHVELIREVRSDHALQREGQELLRADAQLTQAQRDRRDQDTHKLAAEEAWQAGVVGAELADMLDTLTKELVRLQEERRLHAMTLLAERERRAREAEESGRRQEEERRRREEDEIFRQVVKVHQDTVDLYLEDIVLDAVERTADQQAREEVRRMARELNEVAYAMEESCSSLQSEEIVSELVYSFLIPEIQKITVRQRVHQNQRRHLEAARHILQGADKSSGDPPGGQPGESSGDPPGGPLGAPEWSCPSHRASRQVLEEMISNVQRQREGGDREEHEEPTGEG